MSVVVPPGMSEGMMMQVNTAQGMMQVQIPPGVKEGAEFQFQVGAVAPVQAATPVVAAVAAVPGTLVQMEGPQAVGAWKFYAGGTQPWQAGGGCDCLNDVGTCLYGCFCPWCALCDAAEMLKMGPNGASFIDADMFKCPGQCMSALTTMGPYGTGYCIGMCVCPEYVAAGCYTTSLVKMTMAKYNLIFPEPCGASQCCCGPQCLCSAFWCQACMLCLVHRELKMRERSNVGAPDAGNNMAR